MWHGVYSVLYHLTQLCALWLWLFRPDFITYKLQARVGNRPTLQRGQTAGEPLGAVGRGRALYGPLEAPRIWWRPEKPRGAMPRPGKRQRLSREYFIAALHATLTLMACQRKSKLNEGRTAATVNAKCSVDFRVRYKKKRKVGLKAAGYLYSTQNLNDTVQRLKGRP